MPEQLAITFSGRPASAFRFRVWDPVTQLMTLTRTLDHPPSLILMQWTGLETERGEPVFEGDIVRTWSEGYTGVFEVAWRQGGAPMWILFPAWRDGKIWNLHGSHDRAGFRFVDRLEVLGNIYQHPELRPARSGS